MSTRRLLTLAWHLPREGAFFSSALAEPEPEPEPKRHATASEIATLFRLKGGAS